MRKIHVFLDKVSKRFGKVEAVRNLSIEVEEGSFYTLLGPSGCGKTTTLRMIAGFYNPDQGEIYFNGKPQKGIPPNKRETSIIFQEYALFPHMNVFKNISYGLKLKHLNKKEIQMKVEEILELVGLQGLEKRFPHELSGGQQQRVALSRSLIIKPKILLMDEPLSNLDARLRVKIREELKQIQKQLKITTIYVTHDQSEALVLSDKIAVMVKGKAKQIGSPYNIYYEPTDSRVANFIGDTNLLKARVLEISNNELSVDIGNSILVMRKEIIRKNNLKIKKGSWIILMIRPQYMVIYTKTDGMHSLDCSIRGIVQDKSFFGMFMRYKIGLKGLKETIIVDDYYFHSHKDETIQNEVLIGFKSSDVYIFPSDDNSEPLLRSK